jgi:glycosyltransferase involved in cell wall biosynthesis
LKVYINRRPVTGPWGGGNKTLSLLTDQVSKDESFELVYDLNHKDIDVIFCMDPKPDNTGVWYQNLLDYKIKINPKAKIIQRVGDLGTHRGPEITNLVAQTIQLSDFVIFPSNWARKAIGFEKQNYIVIPNRPLKKFYENRILDKKVDNKNIKVVTHHWSDNPKKGFSLYEAFSSNLPENIKFTYIGRFNSSFSSKNIEIIEPQDVDSLSKILPNFDIYLTASELEAGANHVLEAIAAGLPVLYKTGGGSIDEYCSNYGIEYKDKDSLNNSIVKCLENYDFLMYNISDFKYTLEDAVEKYSKIIKNIAG